MSDDNDNVEDLEEVALIETEVEMENEIMEETSFNGQDDEITDEPEEEETPTKRWAQGAPYIELYFFYSTNYSKVPNNCVDITSFIYMVNEFLKDFLCR